MKTGRIKTLFALLLCTLLLLLPMAAMAIGESGGELPVIIEDILTPETGVWWSLVIVAGIIGADTLLGILLGLKGKEFDLRVLPQFLMSGVLPYLGGMLVLAILAYYIAVPFAGMFYTAAAFILGKYFYDLVEKFKCLFGEIGPGV